MEKTKLTLIPKLVEGQKQTSYEIRRKVPLGARKGRHSGVDGDDDDDDVGD